MKKQKALYEDVVVGSETPKKSVGPKEKTLDARKDQNMLDEQSGSEKQDATSGEKASNSEEKQRTPEESSNKNKKPGKDEKPHSAMEKRAEKLAEDPFITQAEMKNIDGGTKEKEEEVDKKKSKDNDEDPRKDEAKESKKDLDIVASRADKILFRANAVFPFDFFPNTITIDANKVNVIIRTFFFTETVTSVLLKEIMDVRVEATLFLGKLIIDYGPHPLKIWTVYVPSMWKKDALKAKEIIEGVLVLYRSENIDTTRLKPEETIEEIKEVGKVDENHRPD